MFQVHPISWNHHHLLLPSKIRELESMWRSSGITHITMEGALTQKAALRDSDHQLHLLQGPSWTFDDKRGEDWD
jgi:hypothetical protein